jgi:hypothetical protein
MFFSPPFALNVTVAAVKVTVAVAVSVRKVAVTTHFPAAVAVSDLADTVHPLLVVEKVTAPALVPPALVRAIVVPTAAVAGVPVTVNGEAFCTQMAYRVALVLNG